MNTDSRHISVGGIEVEVVRKQIKNLHLGVYPPNGRVRVAAPDGVSDDAVRLAVVTRMGWIKRQRAKFEAQARQCERAYVSGETHFHLGQRYRLRLIERPGAARVGIRDGDWIELSVPRDTDTEFRERVMQRWQRAELRNRVGPLVEKWAEQMDVLPPTLGIKRMKTKWGSCNADARRIWLNLELVKKPPECIEYLVVHELVHLTEHNHGDRFTALMDRYIPQWRRVRDQLNSETLAHEIWVY